MWHTFGPDLLVALVGAVLTVLIAFGTYLANERRRETQGLRALVNELHHRRALHPIQEVRLIPGAANLDDFVRANSSILSIRDEVRRTRDTVRPSAELQSVLASMTRACNRYLEMSAAQPEHYYFHLTELRRELSEDIHEVAKLRRGVRALEPGQGAF